MLIAARAIEENEDRKHQMSTKRGKRIKGKHRGQKNNFMDNLSGEQWVKQVMIGGVG